MLALFCFFAGSNNWDGGGEIAHTSSDQTGTDADLKRCAQSGRKACIRFPSEICSVLFCSVYERNFLSNDDFSVFNKFQIQAS